MKKSLVLLGGLLSSFLSVNAFAAPFEIDFNPRPSYIPNNVVVLTFDDGPDWNNTATVLNVLRQKNAKATFFINSENWSSLSQDTPMQDLVRRMVNEGHELANHTAHHNHLGELDFASVEAEVSNVETIVRNIFGGAGPKLSLLRAPHGEPYQGNDPSNPSEAYKRVAPIVAKRAVHIGWSIDSFDYNCAAGNSSCVYNNVVNALQVPGQGSYGIILMHSVHSQTAQALPALIDYIRSRGFQIWTTEDVVRARYGKSSAQLISGGGTTTPAPAGTAPAANRNYALVAKHSNKCLDVDAWSTADSARLIQWSCHYGANERFTLVNAGNNSYYLKSVHSGKCVDVEGSNTANGTKVQQYSCNQTNAQRVTLTPTSGGAYNVRFASSGKCLDVSGPSTADGAIVHQWECVGGTNQEWFFRE